ncbi:hypothetical protein TL16_g10008 [Triparma laevis f. inornata]|uniref:Uncharacterized protein n=2 Tax=Triparma laevis TaxID=1534972 RepID=A0A9W6ZXK1_9STRA|nr:hypothetical protein TrLO_g9919 [Triparma laevis f. longispina]GMH84725.1 hypothetical protein TL16_g10008 [Triparma laevis f. inornata]
MMATAGLTWLHILWDKVTFEGLIAIFMLVYFAISNLADPLVANNQLVKTSREGLKIGDIEFTANLIKKILSVCFSFGLIIFKTTDLSQITGISEMTAQHFDVGINATLTDVVLILSL